MDIQTEGIVLRLQPLTETSLIVDWLTEHCGRISTVARGARRPKSPFRGRLDLFYLARLRFARSRRSHLHTLCEVAPIETHPALRRELACLEQAAYAAQLLKRTTETDTPLPTLFVLMRDFLASLLEEPPQPKYVLAFELKLLSELGLQPRADEPDLSPGGRVLASRLATIDWPTVRRLRLSPEQTHDLRVFLARFLTRHTGAPPPSRARALLEGSHL